MTFYLQYDETIPAELINGKRIKKEVTTALSSVKIKFSKVVLCIENFEIYSVKITAQSDFEQFEYEYENSCLKKAIEKSIKGLIEACNSPV